jgi:plastocyanin
MSAYKPTAQATTHQVEIKNMAFEPASVSIAVGDTVEWKNTMGMAHTATGDSGEFDSGPIASNATFSNVFTTAGTIAYHCEIHPFMTGTVVVA